MQPRLAKRLDRIRSSLWTVPLIAVLVGVVLGLLLPGLDRQGLLGNWLATAPILAHLLQVDSSDARQIIGTIAGALATTLGVLFSITIVALQLASTQFSPRVLRRFMSDHRTQAVLGVFIGTVTYLLLVLLAMPAQQGSHARLSLFGSLLGSLLCLILVGYFLHHVARAIDAATIVRGIGADTRKALLRLPTGRVETVQRPQGEPAILRSEQTGYIELVNEQALLGAMPASARVVRVEPRTGDFVLPGLPLLSIWPRCELDDETRRALSQAFAFSQQRNLTQDVLYGVRQLVDVSLKALSPSVNDVTTAAMAVNQLGLAIRTFVECSRAVDDGWRRIRSGDREVQVATLGLRTLLRHAFVEIAASGARQPRVPARVLELLGEVALACDLTREQRQAFLDAASWIWESVPEDAGSRMERRLLAQRYRWVQALLRGEEPEELPALH